MTWGPGTSTSSSVQAAGDASVVIVTSGKNVSALFSALTLNPALAPLKSAVVRYSESQNHTDNVTSLRNIGTRADIVVVSIGDDRTPEGVELETTACEVGGRQKLVLFAGSLEVLTAPHLAPARQKACLLILRAAPIDLDKSLSTLRADGSDTSPPFATVFPNVEQTMIWGGERNGVTDVATAITSLFLNNDD